MKVTVFLTVLLCYVLGVKSLIVPDELPSLLSVIYSNIPTLKKGTDSRLGWGFRLGDRADFQILMELGPQTYTQPLANQGENSNSKRNTLETLADRLYAQNQEIKRQKAQQEKEQKTENEEKKEIHKKPINPEPKLNPDAAEWLKNWSLSAKTTSNNQQANEASSLKPKPGLGIGEIDAKSVIPPEEDDEANNGRIKVEVSENRSASTLKPKPTTSKEDALDNVDLD